MISSILLFVLILFGALLFGGLFFGVNKGARAKAILAGVVLSILVLIGLFFMVRTVQPPRSYTLPPPTPVLTPVPRSPNWLSAVADAESPQTPYVSTVTLRKSVVERTLGSVEHVAGDAVLVRVVGENPLDLRKELFESLRKPLKFVDLSEQPEPPDTRPDSEIWISLKWLEHKAAPVEWSDVKMEQGTVRVDVTGPKGEATIRAELNEKLWMVRPDQFLGKSTNGYWIAASTGPASSEQEARQQMSQQAIARTVELMRTRALAAANSAGALSDASLRKQAEAAMVRDDALVDECIIRIDKPYGPIWYAAALRDTRVKSIDAAAQAAVVQRTVERASWANLTMALAGMMVVLALVYAGLNALTRGYFQFHLRAAIAVAVLATATVLLLLMG